MGTVRKFTRVIEDFTCMICDIHVTGDGFTNHCPNCLGSKHVDIFPGDRLEECGGLMIVTDITQSKGKIVLTHTCQKCDEQSKDHFREKNDNFDALLAITAEINKKKSTQ